MTARELIAEVLHTAKQRTDLLKAQYDDRDGYPGLSQDIGAKSAKLARDAALLARMLQHALSALENVRDGKVMTQENPVPDSPEDHLDATQDYATKRLAAIEAECE